MMVFANNVLFKHKMLFKVKIYDYQFYNVNKTMWKCKNIYRNWETSRGKFLVVLEGLGKGMRRYGRMVRVDLLNTKLFFPR